MPAVPYYAYCAILYLLCHNNLVYAILCLLYGYAILYLLYSTCMLYCDATQCLQCHTTPTMTYYTILSCSTYCGILCLLCHTTPIVLYTMPTVRGGVQDPTFEAKAKDSKKFKAKDRLFGNRPSRDQRQKCSRPRSRTKNTNFLKIMVGRF